MIIKHLVISFIILLLTACASTAPLQPGDRFYKTTLRVYEPYEAKPTLFLLGFHFPAADYKAFMRDDKGIYFASLTPILGKDPLIGTVYRTGGLYYELSQKQVYYYILKTRGFGGVEMFGKPLTGLKYSLVASSTGR